MSELFHRLGTDDHLQWKPFDFRDRRQGRKRACANLQQHLQGAVAAALQRQEPVLALSQQRRAKVIEVCELAYHLRAHMLSADKTS